MAYVFSLVAFCLALLWGNVSHYAVNSETHEHLVSETLITPATSQHYQAPSFDPDVLIVSDEIEIEEPAGSCERPLFIAHLPQAPSSHYHARAPPVHFAV